MITGMLYLAAFAVPAALFVATLAIRWPITRVFFALCCLPLVACGLMYVFRDWLGRTYSYGVFGLVFAVAGASLLLTALGIALLFGRRTRRERLWIALGTLASAPPIAVTVYQILFH
jgi:hypothetical protein